MGSWKEAVVWGVGIVEVGRSKARLKWWMLAAGDDARCPDADGAGGRELPQLSRQGAAFGAPWSRAPRDLTRDPLICCLANDL